MRRLFKQFSFPGGIPSHVAPETPGSIHEGGELGYSLSHAYGAAFDNPDLVVAAVVGDGEAETGPLATSWHSNKFVDPRRDGAVLPILHLNGYKIANPTVLARIPRGRARLADARLRPHAVLRRGLRPDRDAPGVRRDPGPLPRRDPRHPGRGPRDASRKRRSRAAVADDRAALPEGLDRARRRSTASRIEGSWRSHQVPFADARGNDAHREVLETWMRSYRPEELFDADGAPVPEIADLHPAGDRRMSANPHANGGLLLRDLEDARLPRLRRRGRRARHRRGGVDPGAGRVPARRDGAQHGQLPAVRPGREQLEPAPGRPRGHRPDLERRDRAVRRPPRPSTAGSWRSCPSTPARAGSRATC